ncbi:MAG: hypothetical protein AB7N91_20375 [Candidatus Tectimicrobiota bacterium]
MQSMWLLGGLGLGAGLMYLLDPEQGEARRDMLRNYANDYSAHPASLLEDSRRMLGQQAQAVFAKTPMPFSSQTGWGEQAQRHNDEGSVPLTLLGGVGIAAGVLYLVKPQWFNQLCEAASSYWQPAQPRQKGQKGWRFFQGKDTRQVDAHTRKAARPQSWYAEPVTYKSDVLYSEPFASREEAEKWARTDERRQRQEHMEV